MKRNEWFTVEGLWNGRLVRKEVRWDAEEVDLSCMGLQEVPRELMQCVRLRRLDMWNNCINRLEHLPRSLRDLHVSGNRIASLQGLPEDLEVLRVSSNRIAVLEHLPRKLRALFVCNNNLQELGHLPPALQELHIWNNPLRCIEICSLPKSLQYIRTNVCSKLMDYINSGERAAEIQQEAERRAAERAAERRAAEHAAERRAAGLRHPAVLTAIRVCRVAAFVLV